MLVLLLLHVDMKKNSFEACNENGGLTSNFSKWIGQRSSY